jgi:hypothetical protein
VWGNKHCSKILQEQLLNSISNGLLPFMVGQSHGSFTLLSAKDVMLFQHCKASRPSKCFERGTDMRHSEANLSVKEHLFVSMSE